MLKIQLFGTFRVWRDEVRIPDSVWEHRLALQKLFQILLTEKRAFSEEELMEHLWGEPRVSATLRARISELRRILEPQLKARAPSRYILQRNAGYCFCWEHPDRYWIDAHEFDKHFEKAQRHYDRQAWANAAQEYEAALALYQGDYLAEERYEEWAAGSSQLYREQFVQALERLSECYARLGQYERAIAMCRRALTNTCEERFFQKLMLWHYLAGNHSEALRAYEECRRILKERLNTEPSPETEHLYGQIRARRVLDVDRSYPSPKIARPQIPYVLSPGSVPFVGRRTELARLAGYLEQARQGHGCAALISGEAGWGKTRLAHELISHAQRRFQSDSLQGRCSNISYLAYQPWAEIAREGVQHVSPLPSIPALWLAEVAQLVPELRAKKPDLPINPELPPQQAQLRFFEGLTQFLLSLAGHKNLSKPLVLFIDDLHWGDAASLDFLSYFLPRIERHPIFLIGAYRSEEVHDRHPLQKFIQTWEPKGLVHLLTLPPWTVHEVHDLLQSLPLKALDLQAFAQRLYQESEGVPLFVILTLQHLFETDLLRVEGQAWVAADEAYLVDAKKLPLPRAIQDLIERRVSWLSESELALLQLVSVIGREFEHAVLQRAWEGDSLTALEGLVKAHLVIERHGHYEFSHDKIREIIYEGLSLPRRQLLHGKVLQAFEQIYAGRLEALSEVLARHVYHAGEYKKALEYGVEGLKRAVREYRYREGLELAEIGLEAAQRLEDAGGDRSYIDRRLFELLYEKVRIFERQGRRGEQQQALQKLRELAQSINDKRQLAMVYNQESGFYWAISEFDEAERAAREALMLCEEIGDPKGIADCLFRIINVCYSCDRYQEALRYEQKALEIRRQIGDQRGEANSLNSLGSIHHSLGQEDQALSFYHQALEIHQALGDRLGEAAALTNLGNSYAHLGQYDKALRLRQQALEIFTEIGELRGQAISLDGIGNIYESQGKYEMALSYASRALGIHEQTGNRLRQAATLSMLGAIYHRLGQYAEALECHQRSVDLCVSLGHKAGEGRGIRCLSLIYTELGQHKEALRYVQQAMEIHQAIGDKRDKAGSLLYLGVVFNNLGHHERALQYQQEALEILKDIGYRLGHASALLGMSRSYFDLGRHKEALQQCVSARAIFEELVSKDDILETLSLEGAIRSALGEQDQALACSTTAIQMLEDGERCEVPEAIYFNHYKILAAHGHHEEARKYVQKAYDELMRRAERITNPEWRASFLKNVTTNQEIVAAWEQAQS